MQRIMISGRFSGTAEAPAGEPAADRSAGDEHVPRRPGWRNASYRNHVTYTGPTTFAETGTIVFDDGDAELDIASVSDGVLEPSDEEPFLRGAVAYRITGGRGRFDGASGLITSNFVLDPTRGAFEEGQVAIAVLP